MRLEGEFTLSDPVVDGITEAVVRFDNAVSVHSALAMNGTDLGGAPITVTVDMACRDGTKVIVRGFGPQCMWQELKDHFRACGTVAHADVKGQIDKGKGRGFNAGFAGAAVSAMPGIGEVRMSTAEEAMMALQMLNGSQMSGSIISVQQHGGSKDGTKLQVSGIPPGAAWQELKDLFAQCGTVMHADVAPVVPGQTFNGEVRYDDPQHASMALQTLNGSQLGASQIFVATSPMSTDGSKLTITGIHPSTSWQDLKDHFSTCGTVAFADVHNGKGKGKGGFVPFKGAVLNNAGPVFNGQMAMPQVAYGKGACGMGASGPSIGEVRMSNAQEAMMAVQTLNGYQCSGSILQVSLHPGSTDATKLSISGVPPGAAWQELKDLFGSCGTVMYANVAPVGGSFSKGSVPVIHNPVGPVFNGQMAVPQVANGMGASGPSVGEVRMSNAQEAMSALTMLNGCQWSGSILQVNLNPGSQDGTKLSVSGVPAGAAWQELKDLFAQCGTVMFANCGPAAVGHAAPVIHNPVGPVFNGQMAMPQVACGKGSGPSIGEVRMSNAQEAMMASTMLNGGQMLGSIIQVNLHPGSQDGTKLQVSGIPPGAAWQELKDLFASCGTVMHADVAPVGGSFSKGSGSKGFPRVPGAVNGTVRFADPVAAQMAIAQLNGAQFGGAQISVAMDWNSLDGTKLFVAGVAPETGWQELKDLFAQCGPVVFCNVGKGKGKGKEAFAN